MASRYEPDSQRLVESEKLTPKPAPKTRTPDPVSLQILDSEYGSVPISAMLLHTFYIHTIPFIPNPDPAFSQKFKSGSEKCSRNPDPAACPSLLTL